jgi:sugar phosphate isomerase/epimerase
MVIERPSQFRLGERDMIHRYSLAHVTVLGCAPPQAISIAARCGYEFVGLRTIPLGLPGEPRYILEDDAVLLRETRAALRDTGVKLLDIEDVVIAPDRDVLSCLRALECGAELGARHLICNVWGGEPGFVQDQFDQLCDLASPLGMRVEAEFVSFTPLFNLQDAWRLVRDSGRDNAGILIDMLHYLRSGVTIEEIDQVPRDRFSFLHLDDGAAIENPTIDYMKAVARGERLYVGEGDAPIREVVARLPGLPLAIEIVHTERVKALGYERIAAECLQRARRHLADDD